MAKRHANGMAKTQPTVADLLSMYAQRRHQLIRETEEVRQHLADAIRTAAAEGMPQVVIVKATGYTREQVRLIVAGRTR